MIWGIFISLNKDGEEIKYIQQQRKNWDGNKYKRQEEELKRGKGNRIDRIEWGEDKKKEQKIKDRTTECVRK